MQPVHGEGIVAVLERSQQARLDTLEAVPASDERAAVVRASFERVLQANHLVMPVELRVVVGPIWAETLLGGRVIAINEAVADVSEGERLFILSHEVGHVVLGHWGRLGALYLKHIPDEVQPQLTDAISGLLGREASEMAYFHEIEADEYAYHSVVKMGYNGDTAISVFLRLPVQTDTPTHPGTQKRVAHLRSLQ